MDKAEKAKAALDRLFDNCEEIDYENYRMLDDIYIVRLEQIRQDMEINYCFKCGHDITLN